MGNETTETLYIYYRNQGSWGTVTPRDHIIKGDEALCRYGVDVPESSHLKPVSELSRLEWAIFLGKYSNGCDECLRRLESHDVVPDDLPESPDYTCRICEEPAYDVEIIPPMVRIIHKDTSGSFVPSYEKHELPLEVYDLWRQNPDEEFSYPKLKKHIEEHREVFG